MKERYPDKWQWKDDQEKTKEASSNFFMLLIWQSHSLTISSWHTLYNTKTLTVNVKMSTETPAHWSRNPLAAQNWSKSVYGLMCIISIDKYQTVIAVRQTKRRCRTDSNARTNRIVSKISRVSDKHTPALMPLAVAKLRKWSRLRLVQFTTAGIEWSMLTVSPHACHVFGMNLALPVKGTGNEIKTRMYRGTPSRLWQHKFEEFKA